VHSAVGQIDIDVAASVTGPSEDGNPALPWWRGRLTDAGLAEELARTRAWLTEAKLPHLDEFLAAWSAARSAA